MTKNDILYIIAAIITIIGGLIALTKWGRNQVKKIWRFITRSRPKIPKETLRLIPRGEANWWCMGTIKGKPAMQAVSEWYVTNISSSDVLICEVNLKKPKTVGMFLIRHPQKDIYGEYRIPPGRTTDAQVSFWILPPICKENEAFTAAVDFVDQYGNNHRVRKVQFIPHPKTSTEAETAQMETVSNIVNPVEREIVSVLQAEVYRYKDCGRREGGLGSIKTTYKERSYCGIGSQWRKSGSPELQSIVPDPENAKIESDNANTLINFYSTLDAQQKNDFANSLIRRFSRETPYASIGYFILFVLFRVGLLKKALEAAKVKLQGDSAYGFSDFLRLLSGLLYYEYPNFSIEMVNDIEQFLIGIKEHTFGIQEQLPTIRTFILTKNLEEKNNN